MFTAWHTHQQGWIDALAYGPVVQPGLAAVSTKIEHQRRSEGTCVGTGMGFDPALLLPSRECVPRTVMVRYSGRRRNDKLY